MAIAYKSAGTGSTTEASGGNLNPTCPAVVDANDILILHCAYEGTVTAPVTPSGWTLIANNILADVGYRHYVFAKLAVGNEDGTAISLGTPAVTTMRTARIYSFSGWAFGTIAQNIGTVTTTTHATDPVMPNVTTLQAGHLAVALVFQADDNTMGAPTGVAGGTWAQRALYQQLATTPDSAIVLYDCTPTGGFGTVSGGTIATANDPTGSIGFPIGYVNISPTTVLNSPPNADTNVSVTPTLAFTGTDTESDAVEYEVQIDTVNTFDGINFGFNLKYIDIYISTAFSPTDDLFIELRSDSPTGTLLGTSETLINPLTGLMRFTFTSFITLSSGIYFFIIRRTDAANSSSFWTVIYSDNLFPNGSLYLRSNTGIWDQFFLDSDFVIYDVNLTQKFINTTSRSLGVSLFGDSSTDINGKQQVGQSFIVSLSNPLLSKFSTTDVGFTAGHPFASGVQKQYTVQSPLENSTQYFWRVRAIDPLGSNTYGAWSAVRSFTTGGGNPGLISGVSNGVTTTVSILNGKGNPLGVSTTVTTTVSVLKGKGSIGGVINISITTAGIISGKSLVLGVINSAATINAIISARALLVSTVNIAITTSGVLFARGSLIGDINGTSTTVSVIKDSSSGVITASSTINTSSTLIGVLTAKANLIGLAQTSSSTVGILTAKGSLIGLSNNTATTFGLLNSNLQGSVIVNTSTQTVSVLTGKGRILSIVNSITATQGAIGSKRFALGVINSQTSTEGTLIAKGRFLGVISSQTTTTSTLIGKGSISAISNANSTLFGLLNSNLQGSVNVNTSTQTISTLIGRGLLIGIINSLASTEAILNAKGFLDSTSNASTSITATLIPKYYLLGNTFYYPIHDDILKTGLAVIYVGASTHIGQRFDFFDSKINTVEFQAYRYFGSPDHNLEAVIYSLSGGLPDTILEVSINKIHSSKVPATRTWLAFKFSGNSYNQPIAVMVRITDVVLSTLMNSVGFYGTSYNRLGGEILVAGNGTTFNVSPTADILYRFSNPEFISGTLLGLVINNIEGTISSQTTTYSTLKAKGTLLSTTNSTSTVSGLLNSNLQGSVIVNTSTQTISTLSAKGALLGNSDALTTIIGTIGSKLYAEGQALSTTSLIGTLLAKSSLSAVINTNSQTSSLLKGKGLLLSSSNGVTTTNATISAIGVLVGNAITNTFIEGLLLAKGHIAGTSNGQTFLEGILITQALVGSSNGTTTTQGLLSAMFFIEGTIYGKTIVSGTLRRFFDNKGVANGKTIVTGTLIGKEKLDTSCYPLLIYKEDIYYSVKYLDIKETSINIPEVYYQVSYENSSFYNLIYLYSEYEVKYICKEKNKAYEKL